MEQILDFFKKNYTEEQVTELLDDEILNWVDSDWEEDYESEYDWYVDHNNNEAEDVVIENMITHLKSVVTDVPDEIDLYDVIKELYPVLD